MKKDNDLETQIRHKALTDPIYAMTYAVLRFVEILDRETATHSDRMAEVREEVARLVNEFPDIKK